jgi:hypothetical protein
MDGTVGSNSLRCLVFLNIVYAIVYILTALNFPDIS